MTSTDKKEGRKMTDKPSNSGESGSYNGQAPADEGTLEQRLRSAASSDIGLSKYHYELLLEAATELQKARMEVIDWMDANHVGLGMFDQTVFNAREHFAGGAS